MKDIISYQPPFGILGDLASQLFIKKQLKEIFQHRETRLDRIFNGQVSNEKNPDELLHEPSKIQFL